MQNKFIFPILIFFAWVIPVALLAWFAYTLIQHTKPQKSESQKICVTVDFNNKPEFGKETVETTRQVPVFCPFSGEAKTSEVKTVVKTTKSGPSERRVVITEDAFKETMQKVAYEVRRDAQNEYDKNFATLLTILTIFGIAWPVIIALLQFKFNEKELEKIAKAKNDAEVAITKVNESVQQMNNLKKNITEIEQGVSETAAHIFHVLYENFLVLATDLEKKVSDIKEGFEDELDDTTKNKLIAIKDRYYLLEIYCILSQAIYQPEALHEQFFTDLISRLSDIKSEETALYYPYCIGAAYKLLHKKEPHPIANLVIEILEKKHESLKSNIQKS